MKRLATFVTALMVATASVIALTVTSADAFSPTTCHVNINGPASNPNDYRYCTWSNVGLVGAMITQGTASWRYAEDTLNPSSAHGQWTLKDTYADGDCAELRVAWVGQKDDTPKPGNFQPLAQACGKGATDNVEATWGNGYFAMDHNFGYYQLQVGFDDNGNEFGWTNVWQEPVTSTAR
jgi:hypothetical protein